MVKIYTNHSTHNLICEYFNARDIDFDFISNEDIPKHDQLNHYIKNNRSEQVCFLLTKQYFIDLVRRMPNSSVFKDSKVILYDNDMEPYWSQMILEDRELTESLNEKIPNGTVAFVDYLPGRIVKTVWSNIGFEKFNYTNYMQFDGSFLSTLKKRVDTEKEFFYAVIAKNQFRKQMLNELSRAGLQSNSFNLQKDTYDNRPFADLYQSYGKTYVDNFPWPACLPPLTFYNRTNFELVFECLGLLPEDDSFHITEKVLKPIAMKHPFIVATTPRFLEQLRDEGFKTFDGIIDESYDLEFDTNTRLKMICDSISRALTVSDLHDRCREICEYNYDIYINKLGSYKSKLWQDYNNFFQKHLNI